MSIKRPTLSLTDMVRLPMAHDRAKADSWCAHPLPHHRAVNIKAMLDDAAKG